MIKKGSLLFLMLAIIATNSLTYAQDNRPNIIMIIADDIGYEDLGSYGNAIASTPVTDRIASQGIKFDNFYLTTSSCSPSRSSIISGRYPHNTGAAELHTAMPENILTFPELLKESGYFTGQSGKWHMGPVPRKGFDLIYDKKPEIGIGGEDYWVPLLKERPMDKPFFLWLAALDAHRPWGENDFTGAHDPDKVKVPPYLADEAATREDLANYYDEISRFDYFIGKVEEELERQGQLDNTVIFILSDNGRPFPRSKTRLIDSGIKSPLLVKWPKALKGGLVADAMVSSIDLAPTFLQLAGVDAPGNFQGKSFLSVLKNPDLPFRNYVFAEHNWHDHEAHARMVRTKDYLYIKNNRAQFANPGPADSNASNAYADLRKVRDEGKLNPAQADVFVSPRPFEEFYLIADDEYQLLNRATMTADNKEMLQLRFALDKWSMETDDSVPTNLTQDWYDKEDGKALKVERLRGEMPGGSNALLTTEKGPF
ncbi:sulfatase [uncultured Cyclobacterium sp.]|uniref:sulfatase family protein n=1 Tax=uncultured Cyclobacterium sp. TaxID=453820 RepID=UPI0030EC220B|tara:strand:+ start:23196 stop:24644 length:1449 start_codon:yes stop_codon:yes gene_type:complete